MRSSSPIIKSFKAALFCASALTLLTGCSPGSVILGLAIDNKFFCCIIVKKKEK